MILQKSWRGGLRSEGARLRLISSGPLKKEGGTSLLSTSNPGGLNRLTNWGKGGGGSPEQASFFERGWAGDQAVGGKKEGSALYCISRKGECRPERLAPGRNCQKHDQERGKRVPEYFLGKKKGECTLLLRRGKTVTSRRPSQADKRGVEKGLKKEGGKNTCACSNPPNLDGSKEKGKG